MSSVANFNKRFPEFCDTNDDRVGMFMDDAALLMGTASRWHDFYDVSHEYLSAHLLAVAESSETGDTGALAPVKKQEVDDVIIESAIADIHPTFDELFSTVYGKRYYSYRRIIFVGPYGV